MPFTSTLSFYIHNAAPEALTQGYATNNGASLCAWRSSVDAIFSIRSGAYSSFIPPENPFSQLQVLETGKVYIVAIPSRNLPISQGVNGFVDLVETIGNPTITNALISGTGVYLSAGGNTILGFT